MVSFSGTGIVVTQTVKFSPSSTKGAMNSVDAVKYNYRTLSFAEYLGMHNSLEPPLFSTQ